MHRAGGVFEGDGEISNTTGKQGEDAVALGEGNRRNETKKERGERY